MTYLSAIILGIVQGVAEFLPISSSGHLSIFQAFFGLSAGEDDVVFDVLLHLGTLAAVFAAYWNDICGLIHSFFALFKKEPVPEGRASARAAGRKKQEERLMQRMILLLIIGTLPLILVPLYQDWVEGLYSNTFFIGAALIVTGVLLFVSDRIKKGSKNEKTASVMDALFVGISQAFAVVPGLSRSGTTIAAGLSRGFDREFAMRFSFLMSIPAVIGANLLTLFDVIGTGIDAAAVPKYLVGMFVAAVTGYASIRLLRYLAEKKSFDGFCYYCWGMGLLTLVLSLVK